MQQRRFTSSENADNEAKLGRDFVIPASDDFGPDPRTKHDDYDVIRSDESKSLKFSLGRELHDFQGLFTDAAASVMNITHTQYITCSYRRKGRSPGVSSQQLSLFGGEVEDREGSDAPSQAAEPITQCEDDVSGHLRVVPTVRPADVTPLASLYQVRDLSAYPALHALSFPNETVKVDLRQAELEAALLRYDNYDPAFVEKLVGSHARGTISVYNNHLSRYGRVAAAKGEPTAPLTPYTVSRYLFMRADQGVNYPQLVREKDALSASMRMLGIEPCMSDTLVRETMRSIGRKIGRHHDGRATPFMVRDVRKALPWLEKLEASEPDRALTYLLILVVGIATMLRREELASILVTDLTRTRYGYKLAVHKTKTHKATEPPAYIDLERIHDERICPVRVIDKYLQRHGFSEGPLLRRMLADGSPGQSAMAPSKIAQIVGRVAEAAGIGIGYTGHSLRNGGINSAHEAGQSIDEIRAVSLQRDRESTFAYINASISARPITAAIFR